MSAFNEVRGAFVLMAGGALLIVSLFLHWESGYTAWHVFTNLRIIMLVIGSFAVGFGLLEATGVATTLPDPVPLILAALGLAVFGFAAGWELQISGAGGVWMAIVGSIAIGIGGWDVRRHDLVIRSARASRRRARAGEVRTAPHEGV